MKNDKIKYDIINEVKNYVVNGKSAMVILYPYNAPGCYEISQRDFLEFPKYISKSCWYK